MVNTHTGHIEARVHTDTAIMFENTLDCSMFANGIFLDWDTSNTTVRDNWIHNSVGGTIKPIWNNQSLVIENNRESDTRIVPPFEKDLGPGGKATHGIDLASNVPIVIRHAGGTARLAWNMRKGSKHGFAIPLGSYRFAASETNTVTLSTIGANGKVIADSVAFVKVLDGASADERREP